MSKQKQEKLRTCHVCRKAPANACDRCDKSLCSERECHTKHVSYHRCRACGMKEFNPTKCDCCGNNLCTKCSKRHRFYVESDKIVQIDGLGVAEGWRRGGVGFSKPVWTKEVDGWSIEMHDISSSEDEDDLEREELDQSMMTMPPQFKLVLPIPPNPISEIHNSRKTVGNTSAKEINEFSIVSESSISKLDRKVSPSVERTVPVIPPNTVIEIHNTRKVSAASKPAPATRTMYTLVITDSKRAPLKAEDNFSPKTVSAAAKQANKNLNTHIKASIIQNGKNERNARTGTAVIGAITRAEDFTREACHFLEQLKHAVLTEKTLDEKKINEAVSKLRECCATPAYLDEISKEVKAADAEAEAKLKEVKVLEAKPASAVTKAMIDKRIKELKTLDVQQAKLVAEAANNENQLKKVRDKWTTEKTKAENDILSLQAQLNDLPIIQSQCISAEEELKLVTLQVQEMQRQLFLIQQEDALLASTVDNAASMGAVSEPANTMDIAEEECPVCMEISDTMLFPCCHGVCESCIKDAYMKSTMHNVPFLYSNCVVCTLPVEKIHVFDKFGNCTITGRVSNNRFVIEYGKFKV